MENEIFIGNLTLVDSKLPSILIAMKTFSLREKLYKLKELTSVLEKENPIRYPKESLRIIYMYKLKRLLFDLAFGLTDKEVWNGKYNETIEYNITLNGKNYNCSHNTNNKIISDYLFENATLDRSGNICLNLK